MIEKQRPKCVATIERDCDDERCRIDPDCDCAANDCGSCDADESFFTPAEQLSALMDKMKELPKEIVVAALRVALEELGFTVTIKPKEVDQ